MEVFLIKAGAAGAWAGAGEVPVRAGAEIHPEAGTGGRSREASESAAIIHSKQADRHSTPVCPFFIWIVIVFLLSGVS